MVTLPSFEIENMVYISLVFLSPSMFTSVLL